MSQGKLRQLLRKAQKMRTNLKKHKPPIRPELLLAPNIPRPLHGLAPRTVLGDAWWNKTRKEAYKSTYYHCAACGVHKLKAKGHQWLEGHEVYETDYAAGTSTYIETVPLCHYCHSFIHDGRLQRLVEQGKLSAGKYRAVIEHGQTVLRKAGLSKQKVMEELGVLIVNLELSGDLPKWDDWRLIIDGKSYKPKYKTEEQWRIAFNV